MSKPSFRALRIVLGFLSFLMVMGGLLLLCGSKQLITRLLLHPSQRPREMDWEPRGNF
jgi:hypothetical protein